ncbi:response regulator transcription factor [Shewanella maritima]|uniref:response regulator transcription factor n=1 Tax=Shewanella maritima TaxID=2520507 RepID=UPI003736B9EF
MCKIYLIDDDQAVLDSLQWMLDGLNEPTECFLDAHSFLENVDLSQPAVVVLDIQMPGMDGVELLQHIKQQQSPISVIMLTGHGTITMAVQSIQKGAIDFLEKPVDGDKLIALLQQAKNATKDDFSKALQHRSLNERIDSLTARERQVMEQVLAGKMNKVIAAELDIAQRTIELHRQRVMQKMQVNNIAELAYLMAQKTPKT